MLYGFGAPWEIGPRDELVELVTGEAFDIERLPNPQPGSGAAWLLMTRR